MKTEAKERPANFWADEVRAILDGRKTQKRWIIKPHKARGERHPYIFDLDRVEPAEDDTWWFCAPGASGRRESGSCPYGTPGDQLWVRETFSLSSETHPLVLRDVSASPDRAKEFRVWYKCDNDRPTWAETKWRSPIVMPRWASRIDLLIRDIRAEQLQDISSEDAFAEGFENHVIGHQNAFLNKWVELHGEGSVDLNPWVWVIEFERLKKEPK